MVSAAGVAGVLVLAGWLLTRTGGDEKRTQRQAEVAAKGNGVMPFDLAKTTHVFTDLDDGGRQTVTANDATDTEQIVSIRSHLQEEEAKFRGGDFSDPGAIHGENMPGLGELKSAAGRVQVRYEELSDGARLWYSSADPILVDALHDWFNAQSSDHGSEHDRA